MANSITIKILDSAVSRLNYALEMPTEQYIRKPDGKLEGQAGHFYVGGAYGGYRLERMSKGGGASDISPRGTKKEVWTFVQALLSGIELARLGTCGRT